MGTEAVAGAGAGMSAAGAGYAAVSAYNKSKADKRAFEYQSQVAKNNAQLAEWEAQDAIMRGQVAEGNVRLKYAHIKSSQRASMAARGLALDEGSPLDILTTTDFVGERDALTTRDNAAKEAWALREKGKGYLNDADVLKARADSERPGYAAIGSLLGSGGQVSSSWYQYSKARGAGVSGDIPFYGVGGAPY